MYTGTRRKGSRGGLTGQLFELFQSVMQDVKVCSRGSAWNASGRIGLKQSECAGPRWFQLGFSVGAESPRKRASTRHLAASQTALEMRHLHMVYIFYIY